MLEYPDFDCLENFRQSDRMSVSAKPGISVQSMVIKPPSHPTYDLQGVIKLALAEDAGDRGLNCILLSEVLPILISLNMIHESLTS